LRNEYKEAKPPYTIDEEGSKKTIKFESRQKL
jgi:hypothetical protein